VTAARRSLATSPARRFEAGAGRIWRFGDGIDTDAMAPGRYMKLGIEAIAQHCMEDVRPEFAREVRPGDLLVAGRNFGVGSSREQAPQALAALGIAAVVAQSYAGLFYRNAVNLGMPVLVCSDAEALVDGGRATFDIDAATLTLSDGAVVQLEPIPVFLREIIDAGGLIPHLEKTLGR
jgi:3-isopropylmalate/(R)-2-methylmalate dehydratase small subunit